VQSLRPQAERLQPRRLGLQLLDEVAHTTPYRPKRPEL
jgi:hypothetical protein